MTVDAFLLYVAEAIYVVIFVVVLLAAVQRRTRTTIDIALFFGVATLSILDTWLTQVFGIAAGPIATAVSGIAILALPYLLLRLLDDFAGVRALYLRLAQAGLALSVVALVLQPSPSAPSALLIIGYFLIVEIYAAVSFVRAARRSTGVTRRRLEAVAYGSLFLALDILSAAIPYLVPAAKSAAASIGTLFGLGSGILYFLGFATPGVLRRAWQEPELRRFLSRAASLPRLPTTTEIVRELRDGASRATGAQASLGLWDETAGVLRFGDGDSEATVRSGQFIAGRAFATDRPLFVEDAARADPENAERYRRGGVAAILAAPIRTDARRIGVLVIYAARSPIFAEDDLELVQLLADQATVVLENRALIDEASRVRARDEAARMKEDFLSAAAHDLKTPLTTLIAQAQLLERRAAADPTAAAYREGIERLVREGRRLNSLVRELLDANRVEQGRLVTELEAVDLAALAREVADQRAGDRHNFVLDLNGGVVGMYDRFRILQLLENLVENAMKYSPQGGDIRVRVRRDDGRARIEVADQGIGIPAQDLPRVFDRFYRGANVDDRRFSGMGLGLFICRGIVEQHGGRIWAEAGAGGRGTVMRVELPLRGAAS